MAEACWQKCYYDRKIGTVILKPGDLVLVKADVFKGKRKIKDRWEEDTWMVVHQITTDIPSYKVTNQHGKSCILHWNWLLLIMSEGWHSHVYGQLSCTGQVYQPHPMQDYLCRRWDDLPAKLPGVDKWEVTTSAVDIYWSIHRKWVKTSGKVMWLQTSEGTHT